MALGVGPRCILCRIAQRLQHGPANCCPFQRHCRQCSLVGRNENSNGVFINRDSYRMRGVGLTKSHHSLTPSTGTLSSSCPPLALLRLVQLCHIGREWWLQHRTGHVAAPPSSAGGHPRPFMHASAAVAVAFIWAENTPPRLHPDFATATSSHECTASEIVEIAKGISRRCSQKLRFSHDLI